MRQDAPRNWTISEVARMSSVSSRTLRHYDQLGLLEPSHTGHNGYRYYGQPELLRLQRILLLRELGLGLVTIADVLDGQADPLEALAVHREWLLAERDRLDRMSRTVDATIAALRQGENMSPESLFKDFDTNPYEAEARERWGDAGLAADDPAVQAAVDRHYKWVCVSWTPNAEAYVGLGQLYVDDPRFTAFYDNYRTGLAPYLLEGIKVYAAEKLS